MSKILKLTGPATLSITQFGACAVVFITRKERAHRGYYPNITPSSERRVRALMHDYAWPVSRFPDILSRDYVST